MVGILIKVILGAALFAGSLVGGLAATGRLNHEGVANIPVLNALFPAPETDAGDGEPGDADPAGHGAAGAAAEGSHASAPAPAGETRPTLYRRGRSVENPEAPASQGHGHGDDGHGDAAQAGHGHAASAPRQDPRRGDAQEPAGHDADDEVSAAHRDFAEVAAQQGATGYRPGALFHFEGMPAGISPAELNAAWQRVQDAQAEVEQRQVALDLREQGLQELADDISRRQQGLGELQLSVEHMHKQLDEKIARFERTVILVKDEEVAKLKENAETLASFESSKSAELVQQQWSSEAGQRAILRLLRFMERESVNEILAELPNAMVQDIMEKRMQVSREAAPPAGRD
ncbi:MAG: hypothetical protein ACON4Z_12985 [Planctomycetota bacterium]